METDDLDSEIHTDVNTWLDRLQSALDSNSTLPVGPSAASSFTAPANARSASAAASERLLPEYFRDAAVYPELYTSTRNADSKQLLEEDDAFARKEGAIAATARFV